MTLSLKLWAERLTAVTDGSWNRKANPKETLFAIENREMLKAARLTNELRRLFMQKLRPQLMGRGHQRQDYGSLVLLLSKFTVWLEFKY